jgi:hypothetical protein
MRTYEKSDSPRIYFYIPKKDRLPNMPRDPDKYWAGWNNGQICWIYRTYLYLKKSNFKCFLVGEMPDEGIVLAHRYAIPFDFKPNEKTLLVCVKADQNPSIYANIHIVQNPAEIKSKKLTIKSADGPRYNIDSKNYFHIPHWPQANVVRRPRTWRRFKNICYIGLSHNNMKNIEIKKALKKQGINLVTPFQNKWNDYSKADAVLAVRSFDGQTYDWKPATKLYNAWKAGVPAILGPESAYRALRKSNLDYIEVRSVEDIIKAIRLLKNDKKKYNKMIENGLKRADEFTSDKIAQKWVDFINEIAIPSYEKWNNKTWFGRQLFYLRRLIEFKIISLRLKYDK